MLPDREDAWRPVRLLDHLHGVCGRNLVLPAGKVDGAAYNFALLVTNPSAAQGDTQQKLYVSEQVHGTCNPNWAPIIWDSKTVLQLRSCSTVTVEVYAATTPHAHGKRPAPGHVSPRGSNAAVHSGDQQNSAASSLVVQQGHELISAVAQQQQNMYQHAGQQTAGDRQDVQLDHSLPEPNKSSASQRFVPAVRQASQDSSDSGQADHTTDAETQSLSKSTQDGLLLTAEVNLDELHVFHQDLAALDVCLPPNTLVLELAEGLCLFPSLDLGSASSDLAPLADTATASLPLVPGSLPAVHPSAAGTDGMPLQGFISDQRARQQLAETLVRRTESKSPTPTPTTPDITPEVGRLRGLVKAKLGFAFGSGPDLAGLNSPSGASPEQQARLTFAQHASTSGRASRTSKVDVAGLDAQMVALARKKKSLQAALDRQQDLSQHLTQALQQRNTARQQRLRLDALRHAREQHRQHAAWCEGAIQGAARSKDLARTILKAQLQSLQHALQALKAAQRRLDSADVMLKGPEGVMKYRPLHAHLVGRRCRMATMLGQVYAIGPQTVMVCQAPPMGFLEDQLERGWWAGSETGSSCSGSPKAFIVARRKQSGSAARNGFRQAALLTIGGLDLDPLLGKGSLDGIMNWEGDRQEMRSAAAALGYLAATVERLGFYLDIPLRYPIKPGNSKTRILSHMGVAGTYRSPDEVDAALSTLAIATPQTAFIKQATTGVAEFPLYCEGVDRSRFAYAIYLLNKDVEQILNAHGLTATGASQVLANLHKLLAAAASA